ncbi:MAG TPA: signal recognition particle-docking protein FtsY [Clostridia bacterium]|jgi:fused signal recognition particle receptor|nr:signal recognition particle-docking protein FtsY [Clostridiaceae bacterium]HOA31820.1 signal recognition particle-docking protein FtsY [Clostridia bacterium]HPZ51863.1 signal recognition particle-docking protein FtsY [Clostridia bacterium]
MSFFDKLKSGLKKTKENFMGKIDAVLASFGKVDEELFESLEDVLISSDFGVPTTEKIMDSLRQRVKADRVTDSEVVKSYLKEEIAKLLEGDSAKGLDLDATPVVITVIGVNGVGKTTSIGKMANLYKNAGKKVLLAAGDTFRAAAIDQLVIWAERADVDIVKQKEGSDPSSVLFDACQAAKARNVDVLICDTAGRLHNKKNLMDELAKMARVVDKEMPHARKEVLLVLDSTTGQNAVNQAKAFKDVANITGIILTKLDGTSKGGIIVSICSDLGIPVRLVGVGEGIDDLQTFNAKDYVKALFE